MSTQAYRSSFIMEIKNAMVYRANLFFYLTYVVIPPLALFFLWKTYFENAGSLLSYDLNGMVTYSIITHLFVSNTPFSAWSEIGESIKDGGLTLWLIKPINHYRVYLARLIGSWVPLWIASLCGVSVVIFALRNYITFQTNLLYVTVSILFWLGGVILGFTVGYLVNLLSFWTDRSSGGFILLSGLTYLLSGAVLPLDILPLKQIWLALPFKYSGFFPAQIYLGRVPPAVWPIEFVKMLMWIFVLSIATKIVWNLGLKRYQASGGWMVHKLKLIKSSILLRLRWETAFRSNVIMGFLGQIVVLYGSIITIFVLFKNTESIAGWSKAPFLALIATHEILRQLNQCFFLQGIRSIPTLVQRGSLDLYLIRPCWTPFLIVIKGIDISKSWRILLGLGVLIYAVSIAPSIALLNFLLYFISLIISLMIFVLLNFCLVCLSFWLISVNNLYFIVDDLYQFGKYPVSVYQGFIRIILTTILPLVLLSSYPVMLLTNGIVNINLFFHQLVVLGFFIFPAYILWNSGLKVYQSSY